ncbi:DUF4870 domain-containing protein [Natrarchaeobaculum sulfurireducens]|uniref:Acyltransferase n=1 Tax=Natrarchaeobaculum sulfurireducens TaxID=2044521 RepID=A0A346P9U0_9EURY|nr:DUF4870 domain-containing protein [Natrarchaeobaculum sulfurireducens]AXR76285.1 acyltransferase [Natrarchaeobaculum sulfurireducens]
MPPQQTQGPPSTAEGPKLLEERSIGGIFVHFVAIPTGAVGAGLVYLVSTNEFTKRNARNALDWHLTVLALTVLTFGSLFTYAELTGQGATDIAVLPSPLTTVASVLIPALLSVWMLVWFWTFIVGFIAMGKATFGTAWRYPLTPALVDRFAPRVSVPGGWPLLIVVYTVFTPLVIGAVLFGPRDGAMFLASGLALIGLIMVLTPFAGVAMYLHGERTRPADAAWHPSVVVYIGAPIVVAVAGYVLSRTFTDSINPAGDAMYVFLAAFWVSSLVYVVRWLTTSRS